MVELDSEASLTRPFLADLRREDLGWRPRPDVFTLGALAMHLGELVGWGVQILRRAEHDLASARGWTPPVDVRPDQPLQRLQETVSELRTAIRGADPGAPWRLREGERLLATLPRATAIRIYVFGHLAHHRGQLALYLRLLGREVPGSYGRSRDGSPPTLPALRP